jgi:hypothetical protein
MKCSLDSCLISVISAEKCLLKGYL